MPESIHGGPADLANNNEHGSFIDSLSVSRWKAPTPPACHQLVQGRNPDVRPLAEGLSMTEPLEPRKCVRLLFAIGLDSTC